MGRIYEDRHTLPDLRWFWSITVYVDPHCRYTGPYYLAMIAPVLVIASGSVSAGLYGWFLLGVLILAGSKIVWWATERAWGKFS